MTINQLNPYLIFNGTGAQAIQLYESALGATVEIASRYGDMPGSQQPPENAQRILHAALRIGAGTLMLSDAPADKPVIVGGNAYVCLDFSDPIELQAKFEALAAGGSVEQAVQDTFWGAKFGMLTDAFGVRWMFNCQTKR